MTVQSSCAWCWSTRSQGDLNGTRVVRDKTKLYSNAVLLISFNHRGPNTSRGISMKFKSGDSIGQKMNCNKVTCLIDDTTILAGSRKSAEKRSNSHFRTISVRTNLRNHISQDRDCCKTYKKSESKKLLIIRKTVSTKISP